MALTFLMLEDVDEVWDQLLDNKPDLNDDDKPKVFYYNYYFYFIIFYFIFDKLYKLEKFVKYFEDTWIGDKCHFPRQYWNMFDVFSSRTNNISETYNHQINGQVMNAKSNVYKVLDLTQKQETLTSTKYERVNAGQEKKQTNSQRVKDGDIETLKLKYKYGELEVMDYLMKVSVFSKNYAIFSYNFIILCNKFLIV